MLTRKPGRHDLAISAIRPGFRPHIHLSVLVTAVTNQLAAFFARTLGE
jgi:hypothetical protein